LPADT